MKDSDKTDTGERFEDFQAERLTADELYLVAGGLSATTSCGGTAGTRSVCHVDGTDDADTRLN